MIHQVWARGGGARLRGCWNGEQFPPPPACQTQPWLVGAESAQAAGLCKNRQPSGLDVMGYTVAGRIGVEVGEKNSKIIVAEVGE